METEKKTYYSLHKEKYAKKITCEICGGSYNKTNRNHHIKTQKHLFWVNKN